MNDDRAAWARRLAIAVVFESDKGWNAHGGKELLPHTPRHSGGDMYGFAGGHMEDEGGFDTSPIEKWYRRDEVINGTAGIFWNPRAAKTNDGRGKPLPNG